MSLMICNDNEIWAIYSEPVVVKTVPQKRHSLILDLIAGGLGVGIVYGIIVLMSVL